jgi:hypothetical protein
MTFPRLNQPPVELLYTPLVNRRGACIFGLLFKLRFCNPEEHD